MNTMVTMNDWGLRWLKVGRLFKTRYRVEVCRNQSRQQLIPVCWTCSLLIHSHINMVHWWFFMRCIGSTTATAWWSNMFHRFVSKMCCYPNVIQMSQGNCVKSTNLPQDSWQDLYPLRSSPTSSIRSGVCYMSCPFYWGGLKHHPKI